MSAVDELNKLDVQDIEAWLPPSWRATGAPLPADPPNPDPAVAHLKRSLATPQQLTKDQQNAIYHLWATNLKDQLDRSSMKTTPAAKKKELFHPHSRFLLIECPPARVKKPGGGTRLQAELAAFAMWRFDHELDVQGRDQDVLYLYEIQVLGRCQGLGLGKELLDVLQAIQTQSKLPKLMLTVLKANRALGFYKRYGFVVDGISPDEEDAGYDYVIMQRGS